MVWKNTTAAVLQATGGLGINGQPVQARPAAYTLNGAATRIEAAQTSVAAAATAATSVAPFGYSTAAQADAIRAGVNALVVDMGVVMGVLRQVIADLQSYGLLQ